VDCDAGSIELHGIPFESSMKIHFTIFEVNLLSGGVSRINLLRAIFVVERQFTPLSERNTSDNCRRRRHQFRGRSKHSTATDHLRADGDPA